MSDLARSVTERVVVRWRKRPVSVEAIRLDEDGQLSWHTWWIQRALNEGTAVRRTDKTWDVKTLEGWSHVSLGDWIIQGIRGELYPCKPDIFAATYEPHPEQA